MGKNEVTGFVVWPFYEGSAILTPIMSQVACKLCGAVGTTGPKGTWKCTACGKIPERPSRPSKWPTISIFDALLKIIGTLIVCWLPWGVIYLVVYYTCDLLKIGLGWVGLWMVLPPVWTAGAIFGWLLAQPKKPDSASSGNSDPFNMSGFEHFTD